MLSLGFMTLNLNSEDQYFTEIAIRAKKHKITCYRFVPSDINPLTERVKGEIFDHTQQEWVQKEFKLPEILYDRCFYTEDMHSKQCHSIINWLKTRKDIHFLGYGLPNKYHIYSHLSQSNLAPYFIETKMIHSSSHLIQSLKVDVPIIIKPILGSGGFSIYFLKKSASGILVKTDKMTNQVTHLFTTDQQFSTWIEPLLSTRQYLMQPYIPLKNKENQPFDIRTLLQKDAEGNWTVVGSGIRMGLPDCIVSNLQRGATPIHFNDWLKKQPAKLKSYLLEELNDILPKLPPLLEELFDPLFEIGVDIGLSQDGSLWILDINSKPGRKVILETNPGLEERLYTAPLLYTKALYTSQIR